jgi:hypothetical protein
MTARDSIAMGRANDRWPRMLMASATTLGGLGANSNVAWPESANDRSQSWTGSWTEPSVQTVQSGPSAARLGGIRADRAPGAPGRASHNPPVVGSSPTRPTCDFKDRPGLGRGPILAERFIVPPYLSGHVEQLPICRQFQVLRHRKLPTNEVRRREVGRCQLGCHSSRPDCTPSTSPRCHCLTVRPRPSSGSTCSAIPSPGPSSSWSTRPDRAVAHLPPEQEQT